MKVTKVVSANPDAIVRFFNEFKAAAPESSDIVLGGIYAYKSGYHNTRANLLKYRPGDYSIQLSADKLGPSDKASALDITFNTARASDFRTIAKYSQRLLKAFKEKDSRLYYNGKPVVREFFGNTDLDREVEGWSLYRDRAVSSDSSHLWHIHISFYREYCNNYTAIKGVLDVLLGRAPIKPPTTKAPEGDDVALTPAEIQTIANAVWLRDVGSTSDAAQAYLMGARVDAAAARADAAAAKALAQQAVAKLDELLARGN